MQKSKYQKVNKYEKEILINDKIQNETENINNEQIVFDYKSIYDFKSIYSYNQSNSFLKYNDLRFEHSTKTLKGKEKLINFIILGMCFTIFFIFLPFSLLFCLKKVRQTERMVVYRLGRLIESPYEPGYYILFPFIDSYKRHSIVQKELYIPNLQIITFETSIIDLSTVIRYKIEDIIKMTNSLQDSNVLLKSISRGILTNLASKKNISKIENDKAYFTQEFRDILNENVKKWGIEILDIDISINGIFKNENSDGEDPALKTLSTIFKSIFSTTSKENNSDSVTGFQGQDFLSLVQSMIPIVNPQHEQKEANNNKMLEESIYKTYSESEYEPYKLLRIIEPLITDDLVKEISKVYEFHIKREDKDQEKINNFQVFHLDIKNKITNRISIGNNIFPKADCIIKLTNESLNDLLNDNLKPFSAYLSGKIEIEGDLQDVLKLKKLFSKIPGNFNKKN